MNEPSDALVRYEARLKEQRSESYVLTLFVTGASEMSGRAIANVRALCDAHLPNRYSLEVVDVHRDPSMMSAHDVVAAPTLIKEWPLPKRMLVGDLSDTARVLAALDIRATRAPSPTSLGG
jgi:circadian clock protein KaiB|nr:circadian oscillation regulator KaiB [Aeromicrobium sp.]